MGKSLVILGGNQLHCGFENKKQEYHVDKNIVVDWNELPSYTGDIHVQCDIKNTKEIYEANINWDEVMCVYTSADVAVKTQVELHKKMGLLTPSLDAVENAMYKGRSTECWKNASILNKYSEVISDYKQFIRYDGRKYIFKPNCSSGSRNISILEGENLNESNVCEAFEKASLGSMDKMVIVEEFCEGTEYTVEMLGDDFGNVSVFGISKKYHTHYNSTNRIATKLHYNPNDVEDEILDRIGKFGMECYRAIGLKNSFGHLEVILCDDGRIIPVEIGARSSGYIASHLLDSINKEVFMKKYSDVLRGKTVQNGIVFDRTLSSMYYFYDIKPGVAKRTTNLMEYLSKDIVSLDSNRDRLKNNETFNRINADHERVGYEILCGNRDTLTIERVFSAEKKFENVFLGE